MFRVLVVSYMLFNIKDMDKLGDFDADDYGDMFITQSSNESKAVSLEDNDNVASKSILSAEYSDISDFGDDSFNQSLR